jgi:hypothetical protein
VRPNAYSGDTPHHTGERHGVNVLPVVRERHVRLAEANGVLALRNASIDFKSFLGNALKGSEQNGEGKKGGRAGSLPF